MRQCLIGISKHREESLKYDVQRSIFDEIRGVWIADETLTRVFDISSQSKQTLRSKRRNKIVKIYANLDQVSKPPSRLPYCYLFSRELNFAKMERAYFAGLNFRDLANNT